MGGRLQFGRRNCSLTPLFRDTLIPVLSAKSSYFAPQHQSNFTARRPIALEVLSIAFRHSS